MALITDTPDKARPLLEQAAGEKNGNMAYDHIMDMTLLEQIIRPRQFDDRPVEIIAMSACQTAEGDDRSPLGLSGIALKSGARSVVGSIWSVSDTATQVLFSNFYQFLQDESNTKADALREAQLAVLSNPDLCHPFFWAPFIMVENWM